MKIAHFIYDSLDNPWLGGGGAHRTHQLYKRLSSRHAVRVFTGNFPNAFRNRDGITYVRLGFSQTYLLSRLSYMLLAPFYMLLVRANVYVEDIGVPFPYLVVNLHKKRTASVQFLPNDSLIKKRALFGRFVKSAFAFCLRFYSRFVTVSDFTAEYLKKVSPHADVTVITNGVNIPALAEVRDEGYFLYLGRIDVEGKGLDVLLSAMNELKDSDIKLMIAGNGESSEIGRVHHLIEHYGLQQHVTFIGYVTGTKKDEAISKCRAVVIPSRNEAFPLIALEAFSFGKPVIGSNVGGMGKLLAESNAALLFERDDYKTLSNEILQLRNDPSAASDMGKRARQFALDYAWDKIASEYEEYLMKL